MKIPPKLIVLDLVGALLAAVGLLDLMGDGGADGIAYVTIGVLLMLPLILHIIKSLPSGRKPKS